MNTIEFFTLNTVNSNPLAPKFAVGFDNQVNRFYLTKNVDEIHLFRTFSDAKKASESFKRLEMQINAFQI